LIYCSEPWKRPSFASIMDSLRSLLKPPTPQPGLPNIPLTWWLERRVVLHAHTQNFIGFDV
jgi:hypothetical protein